MKEHRKRTSLKDWEVCKGPGNLCRCDGESFEIFSYLILCAFNLSIYDHGRALCIGKEEDDLDLAEGVHIWVEEGRQVSEILDLDERASGLFVKRVSI